MEPRSTHEAQIARRRESFPSIEEVDLELIVNRYGIGVDCHSRFFQICALARRDDVVLRYRDKCDAGFNDLNDCKVRVLEWLSKQGVTADPYKYTCESTGPYHMPLIRAWAGKPSIVNPLLANPSRRKTDALDARLLSYHAITGMWPESYLPTEALTTLRMIVRARGCAKRERLRASNQIGNIATTLGFPVAIYGPVRSPQARAMIEDIARGEPCRVKGMPDSPMPDVIGKIVIRNYNQLDQSDYEDRMYLKWAKDHIRSNTFPAGPIDAPEVPGGLILDLLCTVPGIGEITALIWMATVCDPARFPTSKAAAAFAGCDPTLKVSAGKVTAHVRRGGNKNLHLALIQAAMGLVNRASEPIGSWGARLAAKPGKGQWRKAVGAVARRLAVGLYFVHLRVEPFSYAQYRLEMRVDIPNAPLEKCGLTGRCVATLKRQGIEDTRSLLSRYATDLARTKGIGKKTLEEITTWVKNLQKPKAHQMESTSVE